MNQDFFKHDVMLEKRGALGVITLHRPKALNALTLEMIRQVCGILKKWEKDPAIKAVLLLGAGDRAFCSGGDLKSFHRFGMDFRRGDISHKVSATFFAEEYSLNRQIFHYPKPTIAFMNGIVMGGGYGIGGNCAHRVVTEKTLFAMPETSIGFFPDVGSIYHLLQTPRNYGRLLALTGMHVGPAEVLAAKLADYYVPSHKQKILIDALAEGKDIAKILASVDEPFPEGGMFHEHQERIEQIFAYKKVCDVLAALEKDGSVWAADIFEMIRLRSPLSVMVTAEHLRRSEGLSFDEVLTVDFVLAQRFLEQTDFYEGIRAALIEKDRLPKWNPAKIEDITAGQVERHFAPTGYNLEDIKLFGTKTAGN